MCCDSGYHQHFEPYTKYPSRHRVLHSLEVYPGRQLSRERKIPKWSSGQCLEHFVHATPYGATTAITISGIRLVDWSVIDAIQAAISAWEMSRVRDGYAEIGWLHAMCTEVAGRAEPTKYLVPLAKLMTPRQASGVDASEN